jgi:hypothetical protein
MHAGLTWRNGGVAFLNCLNYSLGPPRQNRPGDLQASAAQHHEDRRSLPMSDPDDANEPVPWMQQLLDNPFLLLFLGVMVPMVLYTLWGVIDILTIPLAK